jgi:hypothetical protein
VRALVWIALAGCIPSFPGLECIIDSDCPSGQCDRSSYTCVPLENVDGGTESGDTDAAAIDATPTDATPTDALPTDSEPADAGSFDTFFDSGICLSRTSTTDARVFEPAGGASGAGAAHSKTRPSARASCR